jgi:DMSO/TMAO reductase YedYZ molybdopterin-dependent catalytic subunit
MLLESLRHEVTPAGLHYLLVHFDIPEVNPDTWTLEIGGLVSSPLSLSLADLRALPQVERTVTMECAGNGRSRFDPRPISQPWVQEAIGTARWGGVPLSVLLRGAGVQDGAVEAIFSGLDRGIDAGVEHHFERSLAMEVATSAEPLIAISMNGAPLPPQHGAPARLVVPGWYGMTNVKWLARITLTDTPFEGFQQAVAYRIRHVEGEQGEPITRMLPRALMIPPGIPDAGTRARTVVGACVLAGRAWSGWGAIDGVEVSIDGGESWAPATLDQRQSDGHTFWCRWEYRWQRPRPGEHTLMARARDSAGNIQPLAAEWNLDGYLNNGVQRINVTVCPTG